MSDVPTGVTAIFVVEGRVIAHATDFNRSRPGGFEIREAQEHRARRSLGAAVVRELASPLLYSGLDADDCEWIMNKIKGGSVYVLPIGSGSSASEVQK